MKTFYFFMHSLIRYMDSIFIFLVFIFLGLGWAFIVTSPFSSKLICDKNLGYCEIIEYDFFRNIIYKEKFNINIVEDLAIKQKRGQTRKHLVYSYKQAYIIAKDKDIPITDIQYAALNNFYNGKINRISTSEQQVISFWAGVLVAFIGFVGFINTCKKIKQHYLTLKI